MPSHCNLFASEMAAEKFTLEIVAAPEEVKFATRFTTFFSESFFCHIIPKEVASPTHFSLCGRWDPNTSQQDACAHPDSPTKGRKRRFSQVRWGWAGCRVSHPKMKVQRLSCHSLHRTGAAGGEIDFPFPCKPRKTLTSLDGNLALIFLRPSFFGNLSSFAQEEPKTKRSKDVRICHAGGSHVSDFS